MADAYQRESFLITIQELKSSVEGGDETQQAELKGIHEAAERMAKFGELDQDNFTKNMIATVVGISLQHQELQATENIIENDDVLEKDTHNLLKSGITLWNNMVISLADISKDVFQIKNIMTGLTDITENYERMFSREVAYKDTMDIQKYLMKVTPVESPTSASAEDAEQEDDDNNHKKGMMKLFDTMKGYLKDMAGRANKLVKGGIIGVLTALGLVWLLAFMQTPRWKSISKAVTEFINTGMPIILGTIETLADGVLWTFKKLKMIWDNSFGWVLNQVGSMFGATRTVTEKVPVMDDVTGKQKFENGKPVYEEVTKQVGFLGDGIGMILTAIAGFALLRHPIKSIKWLGRTLTGFVGGIKNLPNTVKSIGQGMRNAGRLVGAGSETRQRLSRIQQFRAQSQSGVQQMPTQPSSGGFGRSAMKNLSGLGRGIANLGKGIGKGIGKLIEMALRGLASGLRALGHPKVLVGAAAMGILGLAMIPFAKAVNMFSKADWKGLGIAITGMAALGAAVFALSKFAMGGQILIGAAAMGIMGLALIPLAFALEKFSNVSWASIGKGIVALAGFSVAVGALGAVMMTGIGAIFFGAGVAAVLALSAALWAFGGGAESAAKGLELIEPKLKSMVKLPITRLLKLGGALAGLGAGLLAFSAAQLGSRFFSFVGKLFGGSGPLDDIMELAKSAPNLTQLSNTLKGFGKTLKNFGSLSNMSTAGVNKIKEFVKAFDLDEDSDLRALAKAFEGFAKIPFGYLKTNMSGLATGMDAFAKALKDMGDKSIGKFKEFMEVFDHDEEGDMLALAKMWEAFAKVRFDTLNTFLSSGTSFAKLFQMPKLTMTTSAAWRTLFDRMTLLLDKMIEAKKAGVNLDSMMPRYQNAPVDPTKTNGKDIKTSIAKELINHKIYNKTSTQSSNWWDRTVSEAEHKRMEKAFPKGMYEGRNWKLTYTDDPELMKKQGGHYNTLTGKHPSALFSDKITGQDYHVHPYMMDKDNEKGAYRFRKEFVNSTGRVITPDTRMPYSMRWFFNDNEMNPNTGKRIIPDIGTPIPKFPFKWGPNGNLMFHVPPGTGGKYEKYEGPAIVVPEKDWPSDVSPMFNFNSKPINFQGSGVQNGGQPLSGTKLSVTTTELQKVRDTSARGRERGPEGSMSGHTVQTAIDNSSHTQFNSSDSSSTHDMRIASLKNLAWT